MCFWHFCLQLFYSYALLQLLPIENDPVVFRQTCMRNLPTAGTATAPAKDFQKHTCAQLVFSPPVQHARLLFLDRRV